MNFQSILESIEQFDPEINDRLDSRRKAMSAFVGIGKKLTLASLPLGLASMFNKAYGQTPSDVLDVLQFALAAEYLEGSFYAAGVKNADALGMSSKTKVGFAKMTLDEQSHIELLKTTITALGARPLRGGDATVANRDYGVDITGGGGTGTGPFAIALDSLDNYLAAAEPVADLGVRAYKGQAPRLINNNAVLQAALNIHSVEARHASFIRTQREKISNVQGLKPWVTLSNPMISGPLGAAVQPVYEAGTDPSNYPREANTTQAGIDLTDIPGISAAAVSEAFDEPLDKAAVLNILGVPGSGMGSPNAKFFY